jgi:hypothetical protein
LCGFIYKDCAKDRKIKEREGRVIVKGEIKEE